MTDRDELITRITGLQQRLQRMMVTDYSNPLLHSALTMQQLKVLLILAHTGGSSGQELSRTLGISLATVTGIIDRLVVSGLVARREHPHDRRVRHIQLTEAGKRTVDDITAAGQRQLSVLLEQLSDAELCVVEHALALIMAAATGQKAHATSGTNEDH